MKITTTGRKVNLKPNFLSLVEEKLGKLDKFFPAEVQAAVTVTVEKDWQTVEIAIKDRAAYFRSEKSAPSMELALEEAVEKLKMETRRYAKRQLTWFRRNPDIRWLDIDIFNKEELIDAACYIIKEHLGE